MNIIFSELLVFVVFSLTNHDDLHSRPNHFNPLPRPLNPAGPDKKEKTGPSDSSEFHGEPAGSLDGAVQVRAENRAEPIKVPLLDQAVTALEQKEFGRAVMLCESLMSRGNELPAAARHLYVQALREEAGVLIESDLGRAEQNLRKALKADPQNALAYYDLGRLYGKNKDHLKAIDAYSKAVALNADLADAFFNLGFAYAALSHYADAEKMFLRITELKPDYLDKAIFNLALVQYKQGKRKACIENIQKAITLNPDNQRARQTLNRLKAIPGEKP